MEEKDNSKEIKKINKKIIIGIILGVVVIVLVVVAAYFMGKMSIDTTDNWQYNPETDDRYYNPDDNSINGDGKYYNKTSLMDGKAGITAFEGLLPEGWTATIESNWDVVSSVCPGLESVTLTSPDGKASIIMDSQQAFAENSQYAEGINYDYYTTYLHYMDADTFVQYYMDSTYPGATLEKDLEDDADILQQASDYTEILAEELKQSSSWINSGNYGLTYTVSSIPATMSKRQYKVSDGYLEGSCVIVGVDLNMNSMYVGANNTRNWLIPYSIVYKADTKETFDEYYEDYEFIVANSNFTTDYYAIVEYVSSCITNSYAQYYNAKSQAALQAVNNYIDSNYSSTSSESTNEKVMEMWDDVIKEVDNYKTLDGTDIKTYIHNDTVAQNGDTFYVGSKAGIPSGFTELSKTY